MESTPASTNAAAPSLAQNKRIPSLLYGLALVLFLLPFVDIRCNDEKLVEASGVDLAFGFEPQATGAIKSIGDTFGNNQRDRSSFKNKQDPNKYALAALILAGIGLAVSLTNFSARPLAIMCLGALAVIAMLALMFDVKSDLRHEVANGDDGFSINMQINAHFTIWYYLSLVSFIIITWLGYRQNAKPDKVV